MVERTVLCIRDGPLEHEVAVNIVEDYWSSLATLLIVLPIFLGAWWTVHKLAASLASKPECCQSKKKTKVVQDAATLACQSQGAALRHMYCSRFFMEPLVKEIASRK